jgi:gamma-glutamyltranspeptidase/glutathione hydrolase
MDRFGNAVALTQSIERVYGAKVATPSLGFLYNGFLKAFKVKDEKHPHYLRPGGLARSNASPTLVLRNGRPWAALGATGSERMASVISQVLLRLKDATPFEAVHAPRIHCTPEGFLQLERGRIADLVADALQQSGLTLQPLEDYSFRMGGVHLTIQEEGVFYGVAEPRRDGAAFGPDSI